MSAPVRTVTLTWPQEGGSPWATGLNFSTRRQMYSGDRLYVHPMYAAGGFGEQMGGAIGGGVNHTGEIVNAPGEQEQAPDMEFGEDRPPRKRRKGTRLGSANDRAQAAEAHDMAGRQSRSQTDAIESTGPSDDERENLARVVRSDNARRRARVDRNDEGGMRLAGAEATSKRRKQGEIDKTVLADNAKRADTMEGSDERRTRMAYEGASGDIDTREGG
jgi:hypothetical protein